PTRSGTHRLRRVPQPELVRPGGGNGWLRLWAGVHMPVGRAAAAAAALLLLAPFARPVAAQEREADRFFAETVESKEALQSTTYDGSFTSTTFYYRESGGLAPPVGGTAPFSASPVDRIFTDLRTQLDARHISGSRMDFRADVRGRLNTTTYTTPAGTSD